jgi:glycosyltransferase involved in cell wall biosynthesis
LYGERERRFYYETGFDSAKMFVTNNSLDTSESTRLRGQLSQSQLDATRQALGGDVRRMVYAGRLIESKRVDLLIECLPLVHRKFPGAVAVIVGDGPQRAKLEQLAKRLGVQAHVYFLGAIYDEEVLCPILSACDVCVCPGSVGLIVNQAFVYGLPIITSDDHWVHSPEISMVETGVNGLRFRDGDVEALSSAVTSLFAEPDLLLKMKSNALVTISEKFNERAVVAGFHAAISHAMEATRRRRK